MASVVVSVAPVSVVVSVAPPLSVVVSVAPVPPPCDVSAWPALNA